VIASDTVQAATLVSTGNAAITGRITGSDVQVTDSILGVTGNFSGKVTGGGDGAFTGRVTGSDIAVTDSAICVTLNASGKITGATTMAIAGVSTLTGGAMLGPAARCAQVDSAKVGTADSLIIFVAGGKRYAIK
jgi:hypothetical protein